MIRQLSFGETKVKYSYGSYDKSDKTEQWIRITEGCPNQCPYCYEPREFKVFGVPPIVRNSVKIMDMNLLAKPEAVGILQGLPEFIGKKRIQYEMICGLDYRFMTHEIAMLLREKNFQRPRIAWDWNFSEQKRIKDAISMLTKSGYDPKEIMVFMICNWRIPYKENCLKLDLLKVWNVKAGDCYFDNQTFPNVQPIHWRIEELVAFRAAVRKHNQLILFGIDPEYKPDKKEANP
jgi:hypothetical protein